VCGAIDDGADPLDLSDEILSNTDLSTRQAAVFVVESVFNYGRAHIPAPLTSPPAWGLVMPGPHAFFASGAICFS
jgi:hypothetical protein